MQDNVSGGPSRGRLWGYRLAAIVLAPLLALSLLEGGLRLAGQGYPTHFFVPNVGAKDWTTNLKFGWRFFPPRIARWPSAQVLPRRKPAHGFRVFVLGSSAAFGTPSELYGFPRILSAMLKHRFPNAQIEVINAAMTAINSHAVLPIAQDCAKMDPDVMVVYMGNNEVIGPYGAGSVFGHWFPSIRLSRLHLWLNSLALSQTFFAMTDWQGSRWGKDDSWNGLAAFEAIHIAADDPRVQATYDRYRRNLQDISRAAAKAHAVLVPCTVAVNFRDIPPFASLHRQGLGGADLDAFLADFQSGLQLLDEHPADAVAPFERCVTRDDRYADAHYFLAKALENAGLRPESAREHFIRARDLDALRYRTDSRLNDTVRELFANADPARCRFVDVDRALCDATGSPVKLPGREFFYEHVHFRFIGNYLVASALYSAIEPIAANKLGEASNPAAPLTRSGCARRLGFTFLAEALCDRFMLHEMLNRPPFTEQTQHRELYVREWSDLVVKYRGRFTPDGLKGALADAEAALTRDPGDLYLRKNLVDHLIHLTMRDRAIEELERIVKVIPTDYFMLDRLAGESMRRGDEEKAIGLFEKAVTLDPYLRVAQHNLGVLQYRKKTRAEGKTPDIEDEGGDREAPFWEFFGPDATNAAAKP